MFEFLKNIITQDEPENSADSNQSHSRKLQIATCALFVEIAKADSEFTEEEKSKIISLMKKTYDLEDEYVHDLIELAEQQVKESISIYEFTSIINDHFSNDDKFELLKNLWRLIYVDDTLDKYEDHLIKRIGNTMNMEHGNIMAAKLMVKEELK